MIPFLQYDSVVRGGWMTKAAENKVLHAFFDGVTAEVVGLIAATTLNAGRDALTKSPDLTSSLIIFIFWGCISGKDGRGRDPGCRRGGFPSLPLIKA